MTGLDWPTLMKAGMCGLQLEPAVFWRLTPAELGLMLGVSERQMPLGHERLAALVAQFPDERTKENGYG